MNLTYYKIILLPVTNREKMDNSKIIEQLEKFDLADIIAKLQELNEIKKKLLVDNNLELLEDLTEEEIEKLPLRKEKYRIRIDSGRKRVYYRDSKILRKSVLYKDGKKHNDSWHIAYVTYYLNGQTEYKKYYVDGKLHREGGPAVEEFYDNGKTKSLSWYLDGKLKRDNRPSIVKLDKNTGATTYEEWNEDGKLHKIEGPSIVYYYPEGPKKQEYWYVNDAVQSIDDKPAQTEWYKNGNKKLEQWWSKDVLHRDNGPAVIEYYPNGNKKVEKWVIEGKTFNPDTSKPAVIEYTENGKIEKTTYIYS